MSSHAEIPKLFPNRSYDAGDSGFIDLHIYSNSADELDSYVYGVNITGGPGVAFSDPQSESFLMDGDYVFSGVSSSVINSFPVTFVGGGGSEITVGDNTEDPASAFTPSPVVLPGSGAPSLLARLEFDTNSAGTFDFEFDALSTFSDIDFNGIAVSSTGSSITVNAAAVPEPSSILIFSLGCVVAGWSHRRRRRRAVVPAGI
ncbi:PEP-CTERM sorting domain-containing protein [Allorhodopirellula solitaria]|uniref:Ice-binding protein C-terminal domain-containing protein n=1 Tax=Allorhodopirellula solitaria TaxID=2527987 RepID=A0A5C5XU81_9BACT|nr:PEP-CTERM sorting domain-containing protein [Allorhodopirellula solitaria]TWT66444.1 hypothetical protein CA85_25390 [Allorhodopirellula solitaria]